MSFRMIVNRGVVGYGTESRLASKTRIRLGRSNSAIYGMNFNSLFYSISNRTYGILWALHLTVFHFWVELHSDSMSDRIVIALKHVETGRTFQEIIRFPSQITSRAVRQARKRDTRSVIIFYRYMEELFTDYICILHLFPLNQLR